MTQPIWIGAHTSAAGGVHRAVEEGQAIGATTIQLFTSNQRQWHSHPFELSEIQLWQKAVQETGIGQIMSHSSYLVNLGSAKEEVLANSRQAFREEIDRCLALQIPYLNFHPGSATGSSEENCLEIIIDSLLQYKEVLQPGTLRLLLETSAGQGSSIGHRFEQLAFIINQVKNDIPIGVTIDTCHIFAAGFDIRTEAGWEKTLKEFDETIGLKHLFAFHINDSMTDIGSHRDRHAPIGKGKIGTESFCYLMKNQKTRFLPKYLETPDGPPLWKEEISMLKQFAK